jgi:hypothetical protein
MPLEERHREAADYGAWELMPGRNELTDAR